MSFDLKILDGDLALNSRSDLDIVEDSEKLVQDILKIISTQLGTNPFFPWYGSPITQSLIGRPFDTRFISNIAGQQLRTALETLQKMQKEQLKFDQYVTPLEQIAAIQNVSVERNISDARYFRIILTVLSKAFQRVSTSLDIRL
jgi:hypothetical protein